MQETPELLKRSRRGASGEQSPAPQPQARGQATAPSPQRPGRLQRLRNRSAGRGTHQPGLASHPRRPRPPSPAGRPHRRASSREQRERGGHKLRRAPAGPHPSPARSPVRTPIPEPAVQDARPSAPGGSEAPIAEAAARPGRTRRSTGGSRPGRGAGRAAAAEQAGKRSSRRCAREGPSARRSPPCKRAFASAAGVGTALTGSLGWDQNHGGSFEDRVRGQGLSAL